MRLHCKPIFLAFLAVFFLPDKVISEIYVRMHHDGMREYTNRPSGPGWILYMTESGVDPVIQFSERGKPRSTEAIICEIADNFHIDPNLVRAIIKVESNYNHLAVSRRGAQGLMQLMPTTARTMNVRKPFDPRENIVGGVKYIKGLMASYGNLETALAAYNAGPATVRKYGGIPPYRETINYVKKVIGCFEKFKSQSRTKVTESDLRQSSGK